MLTTFLKLAFGMVDLKMSGALTYLLACVWNNWNYPDKMFLLSYLSELKDQYIVHNGKKQQKRYQTMQELKGALHWLAPNHVT